MRLLPRSRRGTRLLAGAVWCAACAGLWWALPAVPRAEWAISASTKIIGFGPGGHEILSCESCDPGDDYAGPIECRDCMTGQRTSSILDDQERLSLVVLSADDRWIAVTKRDDKQCQIRLINVDRRAVVARFAYPIESKYQLNIYPIQFTPDCRILIYGSPQGRSSCLKFWDLETNREVGELSHLCLDVYQQVAMSPSGQYLATRDTFDGSAETTVRIWSLPELRERHLLRVRGGCDFVKSVSPDGTQIMVAEREWPSRIISARCVDVLTGDEVLPKIPVFGFCQFTHEGNLVVLTTSHGTGSSDAHEYQWWQTERALGPARLITSRKSSFAGRVSPDGRTILAFQHVQGDPILLLEYQLGLKHLSASRAEYLYSTSVLLDASTGREIGQIPASPLSSFWTPDSQAVATIGEPNHTLKIWDIPPRKPLTWFAAGAALLALPIALVAWRRTRKLRAA